MNESILVSVKSILGLVEEYEAFDKQIIAHINAVLMTLNQLGIGKTGFLVQDETALWSDFIEENPENYAIVIPYVGHKVRMAFDPPTNSGTKEALQAIINEYEFRLVIVGR